MRKLIKNITLGLSSLLFLPNLAMAAGMGLYPDASDKSVSMFLSKIFGSLVNAAGGAAGGDDPLASSIGEFNGLIMVVGAILMAYTLVAGTLQTAHDGEVLGKRWNSASLPIRSTIGVALLVPILNGYSIIQVITMWLVLQGIGGANIIWTTYTTSKNISENLYTINAPDVDTFALNMLKTQICVETVNHNLFKKVSASTNQGKLTEVPGNSVNGERQAVARREKDNRVLYTTAENSKEKSLGLGCGGYEMATQRKDAPILDGWYDETNQFNQGAQFDTLHKNAAKNLLSKLQPLAQDIVLAFNNDSATSTATSNYDAIVAKHNFPEIVNSYKAEIVEKSALLNNGKAKVDVLKANMIKDGWIMAGVWYVQWSRMANELRSEIGKVPKVIPIDYKAISSPSIETIIKNNLEKANSVLSRYPNNDFALNTYKPGDTTVQSGDSNLLNDSIDKAIKNGSFTESVVKWTQSSKAESDPILVAESMGNSLIGFGSAFTAVGIIGSTKIVGTGADLTAAMVPIGMSLIIFGMTLSYYLPFLPFIIWFGGVVGWLVMVIESIFAAPLWAVAHLYPDPDGYVGKGGHGYSLILSLVLRPALMVIGFAFSMVIMKPVGYFFNTVFFNSFNIANGGSSWFWMFFAAIAIYCYMLINIVNRVVNLMFVIQDQVLRWIGGEQTGLGRDSQEMGHGLQAAAGAFAGSTINQAGNLAQKVGAAKALRDQNKKGLENEQAQTAKMSSEAMGRNLDNIDQSISKDDEGQAYADVTQKSKAETQSAQTNLASKMNGMKVSDGDNSEFAQAVRNYQGAGGDTNKQQQAMDRAIESQDQRMWEGSYKNAPKGFDGAAANESIKNTFSGQGSLKSAYENVKKKNWDAAVASRLNSQGTPFRSYEDMKVSRSPSSFKVDDDPSKFD